MARLLRAEDINARDECCKAAYRCGCTGCLFFLIWVFQWYLTPLIYLKHFYIIPSLNKTLEYSSGNITTTIYFDLELINFNKIASIYYDPIHVTFDYGYNHLFIANYTIPRFKEGDDDSGEKTIKSGQVNTTGLDRQKVLRDVLRDGRAVFHVDVDTQVRYNPIFWKSKRYKIKVGANFKVNNQGALCYDHYKEPLLKSSAAKNKCSFGQSPLLLIPLISMIMFVM